MGKCTCWVIYPTPHRIRFDMKFFFFLWGATHELKLVRGTYTKMFGLIVIFLFSERLRCQMKKNFALGKNALIDVSLKKRLMLGNIFN